MELNLSRWAEHVRPLRQPGVHLQRNMHRVNMRCAKIMRNMFIAAIAG